MCPLHLRSFAKKKKKPKKPKNKPSYSWSLLWVPHDSNLQPHLFSTYSHPSLLVGLQQVNLATFPRTPFLPCFHLGWAKEEILGRFGGWKGNNNHFVTYIFSYICLCNCSTFPRTSFSLSVSWVRCMCLTPWLRGLAFAIHPQQQGERVSVFPHWVPVHTCRFQLVIPLPFYILLLFLLPALWTSKSSIRHEFNNFKETY